MDIRSIPDIPMEAAEAIYNVGFILFIDDIHDVGHTTYYDRKNHYYKGKHSPDHPSPLHHWQIAIPILLISKIMGLIALARETLLDLMGGNSEIDNDIIKYDDYVDEMNPAPPLIYKKSNNNLINKMPRIANRL